MYAPQCSLYPAIIFTVCFWYLLQALVTQCIGNTFIATQSQITKKQKTKGASFSGARCRQHNSCQDRWAQPPQLNCGNVEFT